MNFYFFIFLKSWYLAKYWRYTNSDCTIVISVADSLCMQTSSRFNVVWKFNEKNRGTKNHIFFKLMWNRLKLCMHNESAPLITMVQSKFAYLQYLTRYRLLKKIKKWKFIISLVRGDTGISTAPSWSAVPIHYTCIVLADFALK